MQTCITKNEGKFRRKVTQKNNKMYVFFAGTV